MDKSICTLLLLLSLLSTHTLSVYGEGFPLSPVELAPIPCNDKAVEKLSRLAVTYINEDRTDGYKFALNRIANVHLHAQVSAKDKCPAGKPAWGCCNILSVGDLFMFNKGSVVEWLFPLLLWLIYQKIPVKKRKSHTDRFNQPWPILMSVGSHLRRFVFCCYK